MTIHQASGFKYDPQTSDWTQRIVYEARNQLEAIRWCNMNRDWLKNLQIVKI